MINTLLTTGKSVIELFNEARNFFIESNEKKQNQEMLLRNYYSEAYLNREFIHTLKLDKNHKINENPIEYIRDVAPMLENSYGKILVTCLSLYREKLNLMQLDYNVDDEDKDDDTNKTLADSIIYTVNRIDLLKKIGSAPETSDYLFKNIKPSVRIKNIINDTNFILKNFKYTFEEMVSK